MSVFVVLGLIWAAVRVPPYVALLARQRQLAMRRRGLAVPPAAARRPAVPGVRPRKGPEPALAPFLQSTAILRH
ncbi:MAG: hypothetical protein LC733_09760 [Actinobacteria bacterium]|nr:hypothetical protein [Actinomycetota bacterium]